MSDRWSVTIIVCVCVCIIRAEGERRANRILESHVICRDLFCILKTFSTGRMFVSACQVDFIGARRKTIIRIVNQNNFKY